jgi:hypothetical protein
MITVDRIVRDAGILDQREKTPFWELGPQHVFVSKANQLLGTYDALTRFRSHNYKHYGATDDRRSWEAHHIFEDRELDYLAVREKFPPKNECLCVLIPRAAHQRINTIFEAHTRRFHDIQGILQGYRLAHSTLGDYSGSSAGSVAGELDKVIRTAFRLAGLTA